MQKNAAFILIIILLVQLASPLVFAADAPEVNSPAAILIDSLTGRILYEKDIHAKKYPASITKMMTAIIALEEGKDKLNATVTASQNAVLTISYDASNMGTLPGEELTLEQYLYGLMLPSANECGNVIGEYLYGDVNKFVDRMNTRAKELGANDTHFMNPHGLHDDNHYTTAYDMAIIARHAMTIPKFREIVNTPLYEIEPSNKYKEKRYLTNTNLLLSIQRSARYIYKYAIGIKTGYTAKANHTLVAAAKKGDMEVISVVLDAKADGTGNYSYIDTKNMFNYGFENFSLKSVADTRDFTHEAIIPESKDNQHIILQPQSELKVLLPNDANMKQIESSVKVELLPSIKAPIKKGDVLGTASYFYEDKLLGKVNLIADRDVERDLYVVAKNNIFSFFNMLWVKIIIAVFVFFFILRLVLRSIMRRKRRKRITTHNNFNQKYYK